MDEFEAWQKIMEVWKLVRRAKRLNQQLYDMLGGAIVYTLHYAEKNKIDLPNKNELRRMSENIHDLIRRANEISD
jgi:hypothetical protein